MATNTILRNARRILKFLADGPSYDSVMKNVSCIIDTLHKCTVYIRNMAMYVVLPDHYVTSKVVHESSMVVDIWLLSTCVCERERESSPCVLFIDTRLKL